MLGRKKHGMISDPEIGLLAADVAKRHFVATDPDCRVHPGQFQPAVAKIVGVIRYSFLSPAQVGPKISPRTGIGGNSVRERLC